MATTTKPVSFTFGENEIVFLTDMVNNGRFVNRTEIVRAGPRQLEDSEHNHKMKRLQTLIAEGDADKKAGRVVEYTRARDLARSITEKGKAPFDL